MKTISDNELKLLGLFFNSKCINLPQVSPIQKRYGMDDWDWSKFVESGILEAEEMHRWVVIYVERGRVQFPKSVVVELDREYGGIYTDGVFFYSSVPVGAVLLTTKYLVVSSQVFSYLADVNAPYIQLPQPKTDARHTLSIYHEYAQTGYNVSCDTDTFYFAPVALFIEISNGYFYGDCISLSNTGICLSLEDGKVEYLSASLLELTRIHLTDVQGVLRTDTSFEGAIDEDDMLYEDDDADYIDDDETDIYGLDSTGSEYLMSVKEEYAHFQDVFNNSTDTNELYTSALAVLQKDVDRTKYIDLWKKLIDYCESEKSMYETVKYLKSVLKTPQTELFYSSLEMFTLYIGFKRASKFPEELREAVNRQTVLWYKYLREVIGVVKLCNSVRCQNIRMSHELVDIFNTEIDETGMITWGNKTYTPADEAVTNGLYVLKALGQPVFSIESKTGGWRALFGGNPLSACEFSIGNMIDTSEETTYTLICNYGDLSLLDTTGELELFRYVNRGIFDNSEVIPFPGHLTSFSEPILLYESKPNTANAKPVVCIIPLKAIHLRGY